MFVGASMLTLIGALTGGALLIGVRMPGWDAGAWIVVACAGWWVTWAILWSQNQASQPFGRRH